VDLVYTDTKYTEAGCPLFNRYLGKLAFECGCATPGKRTRSMFTLARNPAPRNGFQRSIIQFDAGW